MRLPCPRLVGLDARAVVGAGEGLSTQTIMVRIKKIDPEKLKHGLGDKAWGGALGPALAVVDQFPQAVLDIAVPQAKNYLDSIGITADVTLTNSPPPPRAPAEAPAALGVGVALGAVLAILGAWGYRRLTQGTSK